MASPQRADESGRPFKLQSPSNMPLARDKSTATAAMQQRFAGGERLLDELAYVQNGSIGIRVLRFHHPIPKHSHRHTDTYIHVVSGRGEFSMGDEPPFEAGPGNSIYCVRGTDYGVTKVIQEPLVVYAVESPTLHASDVYFADDPPRRHSGNRNE